MMQKPNTLYTQQLEKHHNHAKILFKQRTGLSFARLLVFSATGLGVYFSFSVFQIAIPIGLIGVICFIYLLSKYTDIKYQYNVQKALAAINEEELKIASREFHHRNEGLKYQNSNHEYSLDIDLFGKGSFFQFINRTVTNEGTNSLVKALTANDILTQLQSITVDDYLESLCDISLTNLKETV